MRISLLCNNSSPNWQLMSAGRMLVGLDHVLFFKKSESGILYCTILRG